MAKKTIEEPGVEFLNPEDLDKKEEVVEDLEDKKKVKKKEVLTAFILLIPSLLITMIAVYIAKNLYISGLLLAIFIYQAIITKNFIDEHYANLE